MGEFLSIPALGLTGFLLLVGACIGCWKLGQARLRREDAANEALTKEAALTQNQASLDLALRAARMGVWHWDIVENRRHFDQQVCYLLGLDQETYTGSAEEFFQVVHPDDREILKAAHARTLYQDATYDPEYRIIHRDGTILRHVAARARLARDAEGRPVRINGVLWDITEKKTLEELLRRREDDLKNVLDNMPAMIGYWDSNYKNRFGNKAYTEWFGIDPADMPGKHIREVIGEERYTLNLPYMEAALRGETQVFERAIPVHDGSRMRYSQASYIPDIHDGTVRGFYAFVTDITKVKEAERAAEAANRSKSQFLANMSHEIRTPMNGIIGLTHLALQADPTPRLHDYLQRIDSSAQSLMRILNDILDISKIEAGMLTMEHSRFNIKHSVRKVAGLVVVPVEQKGLRFSFELSDDVPEVLTGDPLRLEQVLLNILGNAVKFTESGGVTLTVSVERSMPDPGEIMLRFSVTDSGIGIPPEQVERIFEPFSQSDSSTTRKYGGTGLGLSICSNLVRMMGGGLAVESRSGDGSNFSFTAVFGVEKTGFVDDRGEPSPGVADLGHTLQGRRVLLVEDNDINRQVAREMLLAAGLEVVSAENGAQALQILSCSRSAFHLVLMDIQMPIMDGYETTRRIRQQWDREMLPIVAMTAHAMSDDRERCIKAGMNDYLSKPVMPAALYSMIGTWISPGGKPALQTPCRHPRLPDRFEGIDLKAVLERVGNNLPLMMELFTALVEGARVKRCQIQAALDGEDLPSARKHVHGLKGMAGSLGVDAVFATCGNMEASLSLEDIGGVIGHVHKLDTDLELMCRAVEKISFLIREETESEKLGQDGIMKKQHSVP